MIKGECAIWAKSMLVGASFAAELRGFVQRGFTLMLKMGVLFSFVNTVCGDKRPGLLTWRTPLQSQLGLFGGRLHYRG